MWWVCAVGAGEFDEGLEDGGDNTGDGEGDGAEDGAWLVGVVLGDWGWESVGWGCDAIEFCGAAVGHGFEGEEVVVLELCGGEIGNVASRRVWGSTTCLVVGEGGKIGGIKNGNLSSLKTTWREM
jgi:hypothetical protein